MMYILDTDVFTEYLYNRSESIRQHISKLDSNSDRLAITVVTQMEVLRGRFSAIEKATSSKEALDRMTQFSTALAQVSRLPIVNLCENGAAIFENLICKNNGRKPPGRCDMLIASIVQANNAILVTKNVRHFQKLMSGNKIQNWTKA